MRELFEYKLPYALLINNPHYLIVMPITSATKREYAAPSPSFKGNLKQSVVRWTYQMLSIEELCQTAKRLGLVAIDTGDSEEWATLNAYGLDCSMCGGADLGLAKGFANTEYHDELVARYTERIDLVADAGYRSLLCFSGNRNGISSEEGLANAEAGLKRILGHAEKRGVVLAMELLNSTTDHPDYLCDSSAWGVELCSRLGSANFGLLYDIYHMQIMEGDIIATIRKYHEYFVHYHTAGVPGRHEIGAEQELNYPAICRAIIGTGYNGYLAHEFLPKSPDPIASLREAISRCDV